MNAAAGVDRRNEAARLPSPDDRPANSDRGRDALFANLALQSGLVNAGDLAAAQQEQSLSPARLLADILVEKCAISERARQGLEVLLEETTPHARSLPVPGMAKVNRLGISDTSAVVVDATPGCEQNGIERIVPQQFAGYELLAEIARGGMGVVFKARQIKLNRHVALKMILSGELSGEEQVRRFYAEAEAAARLDHPNIVPVYEVGEANGQHYYSMALIAGKSLHELVKQNGPFPPRQAAQLLRSVAQAVQYAHDQGIVHRDLKPHNILLEADEHPKVTDFGLAKQVNNLSDLTLSGQVIGTPSYMPPEQAAGQGANVGPLADVYSLGATLYYLLAGQAPFHGSSAAETIRQVMELEPVPLRRLDREIPRDLETICLRCLRKDPRARYASATELALDLRRWLANEPIVARPVSYAERAWLWCRRRPGLAMSLALVVLVTVLALVIGREQTQASRAAGLVDALVTSETRDVPQLIEQVRAYRRWTTPLLRRKSAESEDNSKQKLHVSLSFVADDPVQREYVLGRIGNSNATEAFAIGQILQPLRDDVADRLWFALEQPAERKSRLPTASVLAALAPQDPRWEKWQGEVANLLVTTPLVEARPWISNLRPVSKRLLADLDRIYRERTAPDSAERRVAAAALADLSTDPQQLIDLALLAQSADELLPLLTTLRSYKPQAVAGFQSVLQQPVYAEHSDQGPVVPYKTVRDAIWKEHDARDLAWQRQANAAVCLLQLGEDAGAWALLTRSDNPTLRSLMILRLHQLGTPYAILAAKLRDEPAADLQRALVLSLGRYDALEIAAEDREQLSGELLTLYQSSPDAGVHSAAEWALRRWHPNVDQIQGSPLRTLSLPAAKGNWRVSALGDTFMQVSRPVTVTLYENTNQTKPTPVTLDYSFAVASHEVTIQRFRQFNPSWEYDSTYAPEPGCPVIQALTWQLAAKYCNWLSQREELPPEQWAYVGEERSGLMLATDFVRRKGYRLPTEAEWLYACQAGTSTTFSCGETVEVLGVHAWFQDNSTSHCWPVGSKMPNAFGFFDMHGNVMEWCHKQVADPSGKVAVVFDKELHGCVLCGGSYYLNPLGVRSKSRYTTKPPQEFSLSMGFRLAQSLPEK